MKALQERIYNLIREDDENNLSGTIFDSIVIALILINILFIVLDTFHLSGWYLTISTIVEVVSVAFFSVDYLIRVWTAPLIYPDKKPMQARIKYMFSFMAVVDMLSILPFYLPFVFPLDLRILRSLRIIRLLRIFKIGRYTDALSVITYVFKKKSHQLLSSMLVVFLLMLIASVLMYNVESVAQPDKFNNAFSAFWWAVSTVTTVGYGDVYPVTVLGQALGAIIAFLGIGLVAVPTGIISAGFVEAANLDDKTVKQPLSNVDNEPSEKKYCPYCGNKIE